MPRRNVGNSGATEKDDRIKIEIERSTHKKVKHFMVDHHSIDKLYVAYRYLISTHPYIEGKYD